MVVPVLYPPCVTSALFLMPHETHASVVCVCFVLPGLGGEWLVPSLKGGRARVGAAARICFYACMDGKETTKESIRKLGQLVMSQP